MRTRVLVFFFTLLTAFALFATLVSGADMFSGTWTVNVAKSTFSPGPALKAQTVKFEAVGANMNVTIDI